MNLDLNNSRTLTILVIVVLILFAIVYVWINRDEFGNEGFANYPVAVDDVVQLQGGLKNVLVGSDNTPLETSINILIKEQLSNVYLFLKQQLLNSEVPPLTIVSFYGTTAPTGWQLCNGTILKAMDDKIVFDKSGKAINTPNLQGRVIVGTNNNSAILDGNAGLRKYNVGDYGGNETHTLSIDEIPSHSHYSGSQTFYSGGVIPGGLRISFINQGEFTPGNAGGGKPHNNMQPYCVLTYIIKKPLYGNTADLNIGISEPPNNDKYKNLSFNPTR